MAFGGEYKHQIDEKNRLRIPAKLREQLGDNYLVTRGSDHCLFVFSQEYFDTVFSPKLDALPLGDEAARKLARNIYRSKYDVTEDKQGRFVLPETLLDLAQIQKNVVTIGVGSRIEIWSEENYAAYFDDADSFDDSLKKLAEYNF